MKRVSIVRLLAGVLVLILTLTACSGSDTPARVAAYGEYGAELARTIARHFPYRSPGSQAEARTAEYLVQVLQSIGYEPSIETFRYEDASGQVRTSQNVVAYLAGRGFTLADGSEEGGSILIGANYDVPVTGPDYVWPGLAEGQVLSRSYSQYDGIHDNASGLASVLVSALQMRRDPPGYDVTFVFFGAENAQHAGAKAYLQGMSDTAKADTVCVYNVGPIYAGEKVYAHAGQNSLDDDTHKSYALRRKLYEATDIFFNYQLNTLNGYSLYTNQATFFVSKPGGFRQVVFREWTTRTGAHTPFDDAGFPIVFFESGEYNLENPSALGPENKAPEFRETGGVIAGTPFDSDPFLFNIFRRIDEAKKTEAFTLETAPGEPEVIGPDVPGEDDDTEEPEEIDHLRRRINNTAFILVKAAQRGPDMSTINEP